jgi:two-component system phosphate regulon sensor histidine kinase PhoR
MPPPDATSEPRSLGISATGLPTAPASPPPFRAILEALPDPVIVLAGDTQGHVLRRTLFANGPARRLFRIAAEGVSLTSVLRDPIILAAVERALAGAAPAPIDYDYAGRHWSVAVRPIDPGEAGGEAGARLAMIALRDETEARAAERTRADFLANASHELRTPLASLSGFIETLRGHAKDDPQAREKFLGIMHAQAWRMARLVDDLLSLSRIELNEHVAPEGRIDLALTAADVVDALGPLLREKSVTLQTDLPPRGALVAVADRDQVQQVIQNLVENAIKYASSGGTIRLELVRAASLQEARSPRDPDAARFVLLEPARPGLTGFASLRVSDNGPGMPRDRLPRLTERFYRVEGQKSGERSGTGLGLAIVKHILNRHHGALLVESREGHGAAFTACFPLGT